MDVEGSIVYGKPQDMEGEIISVKAEEGAALVDGKVAVRNHQTGNEWTFANPVAFHPHFLKSEAGITKKDEGKEITIGDDGMDVKIDGRTRYVEWKFDARHPANLKGQIISVDPDLKGVVKVAVKDDRGSRQTSRTTTTGDGTVEFDNPAKVIVRKAGGMRRSSIMTGANVNDAEVHSQKIHERIEKMQSQLPGSIKTLVGGYKLNCYWFEIFECVRKLLLIGLPVFLPSGSIEQLTLGLLTSFVTFAMYTFYHPFDKKEDNILSTVCQLQIFLTLLSSVVYKADPESAFMNTLLPLMLLVPLGIAFLLQSGLLELFIVKLYRTKLVQALLELSVRKIDTKLGKYPGRL